MSTLPLVFDKQGDPIADIETIPEDIMNTVLHLIISFNMLIISIFIICVIFRGMVNISLGCSPFSGRVKEVKKKKGSSSGETILKNFDYTINLESLSRRERKLVIQLIQNIEENYLFLKKQTRSIDSLKYRVEIQNVLIVSKELIHSFCNEPKLMIASEFESFQYKDLEALGQLCQAYRESYEIEKKLHGNPKFECDLEKLEEYIALRADQVTQNYIQYKQTKLNEQLQY